MYESKDGNMVELVYINDNNDYHILSQGIVSIVSEETFKNNFTEIKEK